MLKTSLFDPNARTQKEDLISPVLMVLASAAHQNVPAVPTAFLRDAVGRVVQQSETDREKTSTDTVSRFDRAMLNLTSHRSLERPRWVRYTRAVTQFSGPGVMKITARGKAELFDRMVSMFDDVPLGDDVPNNLQDTHRHTESRIAFVALLTLARLERLHKGPVSTTEWREAVTRSLSLTASDEKRLANRSDRAIDQTVRNLISHDTLGRHGWMRRTPTGRNKTTVRGKARLVDEFLAIGLLPSIDVAVLNEHPLVAKAATEPRARRALR